MNRALLIGDEPAWALAYDYVKEPPYEAVVIGSLSLSQALRLSDERVLQALAEGKTVLREKIFEADNFITKTVSPEKEAEVVEILTALTEAIRKETM